MNLSATQILGFTSYSELFSENMADAKNQRKTLLGKWHPDVNSDPQAEAVFVHINQLYAKRGGVGIGSLSIVVGMTEYEYLYAVSNNIYSLYYLKDSSILIQFHHKATELKYNFVQNIQQINFRIEGLGFKHRYVDFLGAKLSANADDTFLRVAINKDYLPLTLLMDYIQEYKDWKMSAWIISRLFDESLMFKHSKLNFTGCDADLIFVNTKTHQIIDLSALFFSTQEQMLVLSPNQVKAVNRDSIANKTCDEDSSNSLIKFLSLRLAGDNTQSGNLNMIDASAVNTDLIKNILVIDCSKSLHANYEEWQTETIEKVFSERSFYKKELTLSDLKKYA